MVEFDNLDSDCFCDEDDIENWLFDDSYAVNNSIFL